MEHNYQIGRVLGRGSFATVHLARNKTMTCALKLIDLRSDSNYSASKRELMQLIQREITIHSLSHHENIVRFIESFCFSNGRMMAISLEYCSGGDLAGYLTRIRDGRKLLSLSTKSTLSKEGTFLTTAEIRHSMTHILTGLAYLHSMGIVHRDIKGGNVYLVPEKRRLQKQHQDAEMKSSELLTQFTLKIGDFGLAVRMNDDEDWDECQMTVCGTPSCLAPEVVRDCSGVEGATEQQADGQDLRQGYGQPADLWSTGILLYTMIVGRNPFAIPSNKVKGTHEMKMTRVAATIEKVSREEWSIPTHVHMPSKMEGLLNQLLESRPRKRGSASGILEFHPFFQKTNLDRPVNEKENVDLTCNDTRIKKRDDNPISDSIDTKREIILIEGLCRLPSSKYEWHDGRIQFTVFLMGCRGLVIQGKSKDEADGLWLHITGDGMGLFYGGILKQCSSAMPIDCMQALLGEAYGSSANDHADCQPLSSLLYPPNKGYVRLYKTAERFVQSVKSSTPKIILYLYSPNFKLGSSNSISIEPSMQGHGTHRMFAKVMLMENSPHADIEATFVEGISFRLKNVGQGEGHIIVRYKNETNLEESRIEFYSDNILSCNLTEVDCIQNDIKSPEVHSIVQKLSKHLQMAQLASRVCLDIENSYTSMPSYPSSFKMAASCLDRSKWIVVED
jgi:serine/threonine protein kinase